jgi:amino acid adenylation domain-containing protein
LELSKSLNELSRREGATLFMTLLAGFQTLLYRYTGQEEIIIGSNIANRNRSEIEGLIGFFVNNLVLRGDLREDPRFVELMAQVRERCLGAYAHQDLPFDKLIEELHPERTLNRTPVFQVVFTLQNAPLQKTQLVDLSVTYLSIPITTSQYDLVLNMHENADGIVGSLSYNSDLFDSSSISSLKQHFINLLEGIVANPRARLSEVPLLSKEHRQQILFDWNETAAAYPLECCIHDLFEAQALETPDAVAVEARDRRMTYRQLNEHANQLAHYLMSVGVGRGSLVGIFLENSPEMIISLLGVLKSGAGYVPLDVGQPERRLAFVANETQLEVVLSEGSLDERLGAFGKQVVQLDSQWEAIGGHSHENPPCGAKPEDLAYVMYTSGSTGEPKGVKIPHSALVNYTWWAKEVYLRGEALACPLYSMLSFDLTVTSIFTPLISGNKMVVYRQEGKQSPLQEIVKEGKVGLLKLTPSHLGLITEEDNRGSGIKRIIVGGEVFETELARKTYESFGGEVEIFNEYGPTEATVGCMLHKYDPEKDERASVPIGRPAANTQIYLLDDHYNAVPENVKGEIYISGEGVAQGHLKREELDRECFMENPFKAGERMYKSGDLARRLRDGNLEYIGRRDNQVKYHGYRVELNEIRTELNKHPQVRDSVVVVRRDRQGNEVMMGYYVSRQEIEVKELRAHLQKRVIEEIIPNIYVHLKKMPLTLQGKINYEGLPGIEEARGQIKVGGEGARTPIEEALGGIWGEVLGLERVGIHDNFFELGGHSLLITQVYSRVRDTFHVELPLRSFFEMLTIADLAVAITQGQQKQDDIKKFEEVLREIETLSEDEITLALSSHVLTGEEGDPNEQSS